MVIKIATLAFAILIIVLTAASIRESYSRDAYVRRYCINGHFEERREVVYDPALKMPRELKRRVFVCDEWLPGSDPGW